MELLVTQTSCCKCSQDGELYYGWDFVSTSGSLFVEEGLAIAFGAVVFFEDCFAIRMAGLKTVRGENVAS